MQVLQEPAIVTMGNHHMLCSVSDRYVFVAVVRGITAEEVKAKVVEVIKQHSCPIVWVPTGDKL